MAEEKKVIKEDEPKKEKALSEKKETSVVAKDKGALVKPEKKALATNDSLGKSVYGERKFAKKRKRSFDKDQKQDEFEQKIVDLARVTRVMAGGKRMRFRACVAIGNKKGKVGIGLAKGADVTLAVSKAVAQARKDVIEVSMVNDTIPHEIYQKTGAAKILFKPASRGRGIIAGGAVRIILELAGVNNITSKILGTYNKCSIAKCTIEALSNLKKVEKKEKKKEEISSPAENKKPIAKEVKKDNTKKKELPAKTASKPKNKKTGEKK